MPDRGNSNVASDRAMRSVWYKGRLSSAISLALLALVISCLDTSGPEDQHFGTYALSAIDGKPLPTEFDGKTVVSGSLTLNGDDTFARTITYTSSSVTQTGNWSWSREDGQFRFVLADGTFLFSGFAGEDGGRSGLTLGFGSPVVWSYLR